MAPQVEIRPQVFTQLFPNKIESKVLSRKPVPRIWNLEDGFCIAALKSEWYKSMFAIQSTFFHTSIDFFRGPQLDYRYLLVPLTTGSISSPMGLGSDSQPVSVKLHGEDTYLADSQQFLLEYALRYDDDVPGTYYVGTSCRGEDHDSTHLNQFYHVECELRGGLHEGINVANEYIISLTKTLLEKHGEIIKSFAGSTRHMTDLLKLAARNGGKFPMLPLEEALALPEIKGGEGIMWEYTVTGRPECGRSLTRRGEQALVKRYGGACWVVEMHHLSVPFYQAYSDGSERSTARCGDFLLGLGEVVGCGNRHTTAEEALAALGHHGVDPADYAWYVDMRSQKPLQTTGWGIGSERFLSWVLQHDDVRDIQLIPRLKGQTCAP
ncbi:putative asparaginase like 1 [Colletotrichum phormii]|uniref:Asparaginase like 1 n=1 Tax=Colletotrichum phormii TaxID=359342 RepID=A0AAJ0ECI1_9PEZI|nr:putative asparaginase like 1 [Colletotrichum phormii]KAK1633999.1 putative asparaginase like 1 [Colletotrichum phormii]